MVVLKLATALGAASGAAAGTTAYNLTMSDGVLLSTLVDIPPGVNASARVPTVIDRSPYGHFALELIADIFTLKGYVGVRQDVRGCGDSEGHFGLWKDSVGDGYTTMDWIVSQDWSDGRIFQTGASADGLSALAQISNPHPALQRAWIIFAGSAGHEMIFPGGALRYNLAHHWLSDTVRAGDFDDCWNQVLANEAPGSWWDRLNGSMYMGNVNFTTTQWGGWYDIFLVGQLIGFQGMQTASNPAVRGKHRLVIDPLGHCQDGASYFPKNTILGRVLLPISLAFDLFDDAPTPSENVKAVTFYVMGANNETSPGGYWTTLDDWPVPTLTPLYMSGHSSLTWTPPAVSYSQSFIFDPSNPVPTIGGNNLFGSCGPKDQSSLESRPDVLDFTTAPLAAPVAVTGPLSAFLFVSTNCTDTDFTVRLTDVYPSGESILIQDGIVRLRWRDLVNNPTAQPVVPGQIYYVQVSLWNTSYIFDAGHRIRVDISSSNYPRFSVNPNNGLPLTQNGTAYVANNTLWYGSAYPSSFMLPVVDYKTQLPEVPILDLETDITRRYRDAFAAKGWYEAYPESEHRIVSRAKEVKAQSFDETREWVHERIVAMAEHMARGQ